ncbi:alpha/beta fold hydrolase [Pseudomonas sp. Marseille-QA0892]
MQAPEALTINLPHIELAALAYGPHNGPPVLALHGWLDNAATFSKLALRMPGLRIIALDFAGHGLSGHRPRGCEYHLSDYVIDTLMVADALGWERFSLLGHSLGAIVSTLLAAASPERVERVALIDGMLPLFDKPESAPERLGLALRRRIAPGKGKSIYPDAEAAIEARMAGHRAVSREAAELLVKRGLMDAEGGGYVWRSDSALTLPTPIRMTLEQGIAFAKGIRCPAVLVAAQDGIRQDFPGLDALLERLPVTVEHVAGGHHLHLDDDAGAQAVADCFKGLFAIP